jgi:hypothetical protein
MDKLTIGLIILFFGGALPCIVLGFLIAVKQKRRLIAGWDKEKVSNPTAFAKLIGYSILSLGIAISVIGLSWYLGLIDDIAMTISLIIASLIPIPCVVIANKKYANHCK